MGCGSSIIALDSDSDSASTNRQSAQRTNPTSDSNLTPSSPPNNGGPRRMSKQQQQQQQQSCSVVVPSTTPTPHDGELLETRNSRGGVKNPLAGRSSSFENTTATTTPQKQQQQMQSSSNTGTAKERKTAMNAAATNNNTAKKKKKPQSKSAEAILSSFFEWKGTGGDYICRPTLAASVAEWVDECEQQFFVEYASRVSAQRHFFYQLKQSEPHMAALYQANMSTNLPVYHSSSNSLHHNNNNNQNHIQQQLQQQQQQQLLLQQSTLQTSPSDPSMMLAATTTHGGGGAATGNSGTVAEKTSSSTIGGGGGGGGPGSQSTSRMSLASKEHHPLYHQQQQQQQQQQLPQQVTSSSSFSAVGAPIPSTLAELPLAVRLSEGYRPISADSFMYLYASPDDAYDEDDDEDATEAGREEAEDHAGGDSAPVSPEPQLQHQRMPQVAAHADDDHDDQRVEFASSAAPVTSCAITPEIFPSDSRATADGISGGVGPGNLWTSNTSRPSHSYFHLPLSATELNPGSFGLYPQAGTTSRANLPSSGATGGSGFYLHPPGGGGGGLVGAAVGSGVGPSSHQQGLRLRSRHDDDDEVPAGTLTRAQSGGSIRGGVVVGGTAAGMMFNPNHHLLYNSDVHSTRSSRGGAGTQVGAHSMSANYSSGLGTVGQFGSVSEFFGAENPNNQVPPAASSSNHQATVPPLPLLPQQETGGVEATHNHNNNRPLPLPIPASGDTTATGGVGEYDPCALLLNGSSHSGGSNNQFLGELGSNHSAGGVVMVPAGGGGGGGLFDLHPHDEVLAPPPLLPGPEGGYYGVRMGKIGGMRTGHSTRSRGSSVTSEGSRDSAGGGRMMSPWDSSLPSGQALFSYTPTAAAHPAPAQ